MIVSPEILKGETTYIFDKMVNIANIVPNLYMLKSPRPAIGRAGEWRTEHDSENEEGRKEEKQTNSNTIEKSERVQSPSHSQAQSLPFRIGHFSGLERGGQKVLPGRIVGQPLTDGFQSQQFGLSTALGDDRVCYPPQLFPEGRSTTGQLNAEQLGHQQG